MLYNGAELQWYILHAVCAAAAYIYNDVWYFSEQIFSPLKYIMEEIAFHGTRQLKLPMLLYRWPTST